MRHRTATFKINRSSAHVRALLANAVCSLLEHGRITTTLVKAKEIRRFADKAITMGKAGSLHARSLATSLLHQHGIVKRLFEEIAPQYKERNGGYTRIMKLGPRRGDAAELAILELVENDETATAAKTAAEAPKAEEAPKSEDAPNAEDAPQADDAPKA